MQEKDALLVLLPSSSHRLSTLRPTKLWRMTFERITSKLGFHTHQDVHLSHADRLANGLV